MEAVKVFSGAIGGHEFWCLGPSSSSCLWGIGSWPPSVGRGDPLVATTGATAPSMAIYAGAVEAVNSCPPGTEISPVGWIGTCTNPVDGNNYVISYNDCCGKSTCGRCFCNTNDGDKPVYIPSRNNDINWCLGHRQSYHCSTAVVMGKT